LGTEFGLALVKLSLQPQFQTVKNTSWFLFFLLFAVSCLDDPDCYLLNNDKVGIAFGVLGSTAADSVRIQSLTINDVTYIGDTVASLVLLADKFRDSSRIEIQTVDGQLKVLSLEYDVQVQFVSEECGARYIISGLKTREHNFDFLEIVDSSPGRDAGSVNVRILRCPHPDTIGLKFYQLTLPATGDPAAIATTAELEYIATDGGTLFYENSKRASLKLPVNMAAGSTEYTFQFANDFGYAVPTRMLKLDYEVKTELRYEMCGTQEFIDKLELGIPPANAFDSVSLAVDADGDTARAVTDPISTNINLYRCPPTNLIQLAFIDPETENAETIAITSITNNYNSEVLYADTRQSRVQLSLNPNTTSTQFNVQYGNTTETITLNYTWSEPVVFKNEFACSGRKVIQNLSTSGNARAAIVEDQVLYPAVTNVSLEVTQ
jgi:hypothetical protein